MQEKVTLTLLQSMCEHILTAQMTNEALLLEDMTDLCVTPPGQSGMGRYHGKHTFDQLSHHRACMVRSLGMESVNLARYPPQNRQRARRARMALTSPLIDMSKRTLVWAILATIIGLGLLIALLVILLIAAGLNCTCWYWRGFYN